MPAVGYYSQKEPAADAVIWRFMDLRKFRDLMASEELYFPVWRQWVFPALWTFNISRQH